MLSFKERRLRDTMRKEQKRAERLSYKTVTTGEEIVESLKRGAKLSSEDLKKIKTSIGIFIDGGEMRDKILDNLSRKHKALYQIAKNEFKTEWADSFYKLMDNVSRQAMFRPYNITWPEWRQFGMEAGMNEEEVVNALKIMLVFKDH